MIVQVIGKGKPPLDVFYPSTTNHKYVESPQLSIVIPIKDRCGARLRNTMCGIQLQNYQNIETIVVDYGSNRANYKQLLKDLSPFNCIVYRYPTEEIWSPAVAKNIGIRRARGTYIATLDADCIMERQVVIGTLKLLKKKEKSYVKTKMRFLNEDVDITQIKLPEDFKKCHANHYKKRLGFGAYLAVHRDWWFYVRGCDERMRGWGANDDDIMKRVDQSGYTPIILSRQDISEKLIFHQWHPKSRPAFDRMYGQKYLDMFNNNVKILKEDNTLKRNKKKRWGMWS